MASSRFTLVRSAVAVAAATGCFTSITAVAVDTSANIASPAPTSSEARTIFYNLLKDRTDAVENNRYAKIEPLYAHDDGLLVLRHEVVMRGWPAVEAYWKKSLSRPPRQEPFRVHWNDDLMVVVQGDLIVGGLTWSNQLGQNPPHYGCLSLALQRRADKWVIVHEHSSNWTKPATASSTARAE
jgi:SnoaL-like domain